VSLVSRTCSAKETMTCPHCHGAVPIGATVCRGCKEEISYGAPFWTIVVTFLLAVFLAIQVGVRTNSTLGWISGLVTFFGGHYLLESKLFVNRVAFNRHYKTT